MKQEIYAIQIDYIDPQTKECEYTETRCAFRTLAAAQAFLKDIVADWTNDGELYLESVNGRTASIKTTNPQRYNDMFIMIEQISLYDKL